MKRWLTGAFAAAMFAAGQGNLLAMQKSPEGGLSSSAVTPPALRSVELHMRQPGPGVVLTFDACDGKTDWDLLNFMIDHRVHATFFVSGRWMKGNPAAVEAIRNNLDLFQVENHGWMHEEAVLRQQGDYNLRTVETLQGLAREVDLDAGMIRKKFDVSPTWYRSAGALYDEASERWLKDHGWKIAGFSIAADGGGRASASRIVRNMEKAAPGDVLLMHINRPQSHAYEGFVRGFGEWEKKKLRVVPLHS